MSARVEQESSSSDGSVAGGLGLLVFRESSVIRGNGLFYKLFTCMGTIYFACL